MTEARVGVVDLDVAVGFDRFQFHGDSRVAPSMTVAGPEHNRAARVFKGDRTARQLVRPCAGPSNPKLLLPMKVTISSLLIVAALVGCASGAPTSTAATRVDNVAALNGARLELLEEGGIAAFSTSYTARHDDRVFTFSRRH